MRRQLSIHLVILAVFVTSCLAIAGMDEVGKSPWGGGGILSTATRAVLSAQVLMPRLKGGGDLWAFSSSPVESTPALAHPALGLSSAADVAADPVVRFSCRGPAGCRPPPQS